MGNFVDLIQRGFWVILKITFADLCKPIQDVIIIPVSSGLRFWKIWNGREKEQKFECLENEKSFVD